MASVALYRKYRPYTFDDVVEQSAIVTTLKNQVESGNIGHAYLFTGSRGTGKTSVAKIFARAINCETPIHGSACGKCATCKALSLPTNIDIAEIDAASNNRVDEIREIREKVNFLPAIGKYKVFIIDEVHMLTDSAFNALLKTLEEPPEHVVFILATTEVHKLPATILSRCMRFDFSLISVEGLCKHLKNIFEKENIEYTQDAILAIAEAGEGSVRDTLSIADCVLAYGGGKVDTLGVEKVLGTSDKKELFSLATAIKDKDIGEGLSIIYDVASSGKNLNFFARDITLLMRDMLIVKSAKTAKEMLSLTEESYEGLKALADKFDSKDLVTYMQTFSSIESDIKYALNPRTLIETAFLTCALGEEGLKKN